MNALKLFGLMFLNYLLNAASIRLLAASNYGGVAAVDFGIAWWGFAMTRLIVEDARTWVDRLAYASGGTVGSLAGMWITR